MESSGHLVKIHDSKPNLISTSKLWTVLVNLRYTFGRSYFSERRSKGAKRSFRLKVILPILLICVLAVTCQILLYYTNGKCKITRFFKSDYFIAGNILMKKINNHYNKDWFEMTNIDTYSSMCRREFSSQFCTKMTFFHIGAGLCFIGID